MKFVALEQVNQPALVDQNVRAVLMFAVSNRINAPAEQCLTFADADRLIVSSCRLQRRVFVTIPERQAAIVAEDALCLWESRESGWQFELAPDVPGWIPAVKSKPEPCGPIQLRG